MKALNEKEFLALIERYESITIEEIEEHWHSLSYNDAEYTMGCITGFGNKSTCSLCLSADKNCRQCVYSVKKSRPEKYCINSKTYDNVADSQTETELLEALKKRAKYMRKVYADYLKQL